MPARSAPEFSRLAGGDQPLSYKTMNFRMDNGKDHGPAKALDLLAAGEHRRIVPQPLAEHSWETFGRALWLGLETGHNVKWKWLGLETGHTVK